MENTWLAGQTEIAAAHPPLWSHFDYAARQAYRHAQTEAVRSSWSEIAPVFLLAGVLHESGTTADKILIRCGVDRNELRAALVELITRGSGWPDSEPVGLDSNARGVIGKAYQAMHEYKSQHLGTEHLLWALASYPSPASLLLESHKLTPEVIAAVWFVQRSTAKSCGKGWRGKIKLFGQLFLLTLALILLAAMLFHGCVR